MWLRLVAMLSSYARNDRDHLNRLLQIIAIIDWRRITQNSAELPWQWFALLYSRNNKFHHSLDTEQRTTDSVLLCDVMRISGKTKVSCFAADCDHTSESHHCWILCPFSIGKRPQIQNWFQCASKLLPLNYMAHPVVTQMWHLNNVNQMSWLWQWIGTWQVK